MDALVEGVKWLVLHGPEIVSAAVGVLSAIGAVFMLIPGDEPEATLKKVVGWIEAFSVKPKDE